MNEEPRSVPLRTRFRSGGHELSAQRFLIALPCLAVLVCGCGPSKEEIIEREKEVALEHARGLVTKMTDEIQKLMLAGMKAQLKDPESAKFENLKARRIVDEQHEFAGGVLCGEINAKNSYGGYTGFKPFYATYDATKEEWDLNILSDDNKNYFNALYKLTCN